MQNKLLRVAHIIGSVEKGGVEFVVFNYYRAINRSKIQFDFIVDEDSPCEIPQDILDLGCTVFKIPSYKCLATYVGALRKIFSDRQYNIVHSHMNTLSVFALFAAKLAGVPTRIAHSHSTAGKGELARNILKYALRPFSRMFATHFFACSEHAGRWLFGNRAFDNGRVTVIRNAIDTPKFQFNIETRERIRLEMDIADQFVVGHVGRFMPQKNHDFLLDVFADLHKKNKESVLLLIGDGKLRHEVECKVKLLNIENSVRFLGVRDNIHELYQAMDVFVLPSLYEGLGLVGVEAQCAGLPCVFSREVPSEAVTGKFVKILPLDSNVAQWSHAIFQQLSFEDRSNEGCKNAKLWDINNEAERLTELLTALSVHGRQMM